MMGATIDLDASFPKAAGDVDWAAGQHLKTRIYHALWMELSTAGLRFTNVNCGV
jgi:hypothetical protein